jgi:hypothetical protein
VQFAKFWKRRYGYVSKPWYPDEHQLDWKWMFIPPKYGNITMGFDTSPIKFIG